jgi:hypothetical protein
MKQLKSIILVLFILTIAGCSKDNPVAASGTGGTIGGIGGGGTGSLNWTIGQKPGNQGGIIFTASPSTAVTVSLVRISLPSQNYQEDLQGDGQTVFQGGQFYELEEFIGISSGQQWTFRFVGKIGNAQGQDYDLTANYTVP